MKLLAIVIAYNPDYKELKENLYSYVNGVDHLIIWNNTPKLSNDEFEKLLDMDKAINNVEIRGDKENHLIAYPINRAIEWGIENNFTHILTMDQDSHFDKGAMEKYRANIDEFNSDIYGANIIMNGVAECNSTTPQPIISVITSGSIYNLEMFKNIGLLREDYGIDAVDMEICFRAIKHNYKINVLPYVRLNHQLGMPQQTKFGFTTLNYSAFRRYHIIRNYIWLKKEYPDLYKELGSTVFFKQVFYKGFIKVIFAEKDKLSKTIAIFKGAIDGHLLKREKASLVKLFVDKPNMIKK